jgi:hypothetical protein
MREGRLRAGAFSAAVAVVAVATAGSARAQTPEDPPPPVPVAAPSSADQAPRAIGSSWYGYQLLMTDAFAVMTLAGAASVGTNGGSGSSALSVPLGALGSFVYVGAGAAIHGLHHHSGKAAASVLLRIGSPIVGAIIGAFAGRAMAARSQPSDGDTVDPQGFLELVGGVMGFGAGMLSAILVDDVFIAVDRPASDSDAPVAPLPRTALAVTPYAGAVPGARGEAQAALGVTGRF